MSAVTLDKWDDHLDLAYTRIKYDFGHQGDSPRWAHATWTAPARVWMMAPVVPARVLRRARVGFPLLMAATAVTFVSVLVALLLLGDQWPTLAVMLAIAAVVIGGIALLARVGDAMEEYRRRHRLRVWLTRSGRYYLGQVTEALEVVRQTLGKHPHARELYDALLRTSAGFYELLRADDELEAQQSANTRSITRVVDEEYVRRRLLAVNDLLGEVVAVHLAAASFLTLAVEETSTRISVLELDVSVHQRNLDEALEAVRRLTAAL